LPALLTFVSFVIVALEQSAANLALLLLVTSWSAPLDCFFASRKLVSLNYQH